MTIEFRPAKREGAPVLIGIAGPSGSGKTFSALRLARGLANGEPFAMIDTENGRALHYADFFPEMQHGHLRAPFSPDAYRESILAADAAGYPVIVVDSASHEWEGTGGVLEMQAVELKRLGGGDNVQMLSWAGPKKSHKQFVSALLQVKAHVILCMRAEDKIDLVKDSKGKTQVVPKQSLVAIEGWIPICEKRLPFELTISLLVLPGAPGVPRPVKLQEQHKAFVPLDKPLSEETGRLLGEWARGGEARPVSAPVVAAPAVAADPDEAEALRVRLLAAADTLGVLDATQGAIATNGATHALDPAKHVEWLKRQLKTAEANLGTRLETAGSQFQPPVGVSVPARTET